MSESTPRPHPPAPAPPGAAGGAELAGALARLEGLEREDLDAVHEAAEETHRLLRARLGHAGGR